MGYNTNYRLKVENEGIDRNEAYDLAVYSSRDANDEKFIEYLLGKRYLFDNSEGRWDDMDKDMKGVSSKFQGVLFIVDGEGEESGDIWRTYYKNGKKQECKAKIVFDDFDESLMV